MEEQSGVAKSAFREGHYWTAMILLGTANPERSGDFLPEENFSLLASYYVARTGPEATDRLIARSSGTGL
jgi:hypothetical protein